MISKSGKSKTSKQKNRPFKGSKKRSARFKVNNQVSKKIKKKLNKQLKKEQDQETNEMDIESNEKSTLKKNKKIKHPKPVKKDQSSAPTETMEVEKKTPALINQVISKLLTLEQQQEFDKSKIKHLTAAVVALNNDADSLEFMNWLGQHYKQQVVHGNIQETMSSISMIPTNLQIKEGSTHISIIPCSRNVSQILDICKAADCIIFLLSAKSCNASQINLDPYANSAAIDQLGYRTLSCLKAQGLLPAIKVIQHIESQKQSERSKVRKLFTRYYTSEIDDKRIVVQENQMQMIRHVISIGEQNLEWRDSRGYMIANHIFYKIDTQELQLYGVWKGQGIQSDQLVHLSNCDDFKISRIQVLHKDRSKGDIQEEIKVIAENFPTSAQETLDCLAVKEEDPDQLLAQFQSFGNFQEHKQSFEEEPEIKDQLSDISDQEPEENLTKFELFQRNRDELDFEDEVEYAADTSLRDRYKKYIGMKSLKTTKWDPNVNLPKEYDHIYIFRQYNLLQAKVLEEQKSTFFASHNQLVCISLQNVTPAQLYQIYTNESPFIISGLLKYERKMTQVHLKIKKHVDYEHELKSKEDIIVQIGFRKAKLNVIYSQIINQSDKSKYVRSIKNNHVFYLCSFYFYNTFVANPSLLFLNETDAKQGVLMANGTIWRNDPTHPIIKRIIFTGYPFKINKRRAIIRLMFFQPEDAKYYQSVELTSKLGLKGHIEQSLGTHGHIKCLFNNFVRPNDIICLNLYKRVFPKWR